MACSMIYWGDNYYKFYETFIEYGAVVDISNLIDQKIGLDRKKLELFYQQTQRSIGRNRLGKCGVAQEQTKGNMVDFFHLFCGRLVGI